MTHHAPFAPVKPCTTISTKKKRFPSTDSSGGSPILSSHYRQHSLSVWRRLIPKLHSAGATNIFPQHNALAGGNREGMYKGVVRPNSYSHGYIQVRDRQIQNEMRQIRP